MLRIVGVVYQGSNQVGFVAFNEETLMSNMIENAVLKQMLSSGFKFRNLSVENNKLKCYDMALNLLPKYDTSGRYIESKASLVIVAISGPVYLVLNNKFGIEQVPKDKLEKLLGLDVTYIRNAYIANGSLALKSKDSVPVITAPIAKPNSKASGTSAEVVRISRPGACSSVIDFYSAKDMECTCSPDIIDWCNKHNVPVSKFNQPVIIDSKMTDLTCLFANCHSFNQPIVLPANAKTCNGLLYKCTSFNKDLVLPSTVVHVRRMMDGCTVFYAQPRPYDPEEVIVVHRHVDDNSDDSYSAPTEILNWCLSHRVPFERFNQPIALAEGASAFCLLSDPVGKYYNQPLPLFSPKTMYSPAVLAGLENYKQPLYLSNSDCINCKGDVPLLMIGHPYYPKYDLFAYNAFEGVAHNIIINGNPPMGLCSTIILKEIPKTGVNVYIRDYELFSPIELSGDFSIFDARNPKLDYRYPWRLLYTDEFCSDIDEYIVDHSNIILWIDNKFKSILDYAIGHKTGLILDNLASRLTKTSDGAYKCKCISREGTVSYMPIKFCDIETVTRNMVIKAFSKDGSIPLDTDGNPIIQSMKVPDKMKQFMQRYGINA